MTKYAVRLKGSKEHFLIALGERDEDFILDPESNPTTVWVTTTVPMHDMLKWEELVEDVIESSEQIQKDIEELTGETFEDMGIDEEHLYEDDEKTYKIVRKYKDATHPSHDEVIKRNLTRKEAQDHCSRDDTHEKGVWFDAFYEE